MRTMAFEVVGAVCVVLHTLDPPSDAEWDRYLSFNKTGAIEGTTRFLVFTDGGGPTAAQRRRMYDLLKGHTTNTAVVSRNAFIRSIVIALSVFNRAVRGFAPDSIDAARIYLNITESQWRAVMRTITKLRAELASDQARGAER